MKKAIILIAALFLTACQPFLPSENKNKITSFEDCIAAGFPAMESYPRQCQTDEGALFVELLDEPVAPPADMDPSQPCSDSGGNWLANYNECEYTSQEWCNKKGGEFKECESACRHDPTAEICTLQCVPVCQF